MWGCLFVCLLREVCFPFVERSLLPGDRNSKGNVCTVIEEFFSLKPECVVCFVFSVVGTVATLHSACVTTASLVSKMGMFLLICEQDT